MQVTGSRLKGYSVQKRWLGGDVLSVQLGTLRSITGMTGHLKWSILKNKRCCQKSSKMKAFDRRQDTTRLKHRIGEVNQTRNDVTSRQAGRSKASIYWPVLCCDVIDNHHSCLQASCLLRTECKRLKRTTTTFTDSHHRALIVIIHH